MPAKKPKDKVLYNKIKAQAKRKFEVYPSRYATMWMVQQYKKKGGTYVKPKPKK